VWNDLGFYLPEKNYRNGDYANQKGQQQHGKLGARPKVDLT
jgi:hypothetical protein